MRRHFKAVEVLDRGARVRVQPGVTVRQVNARLAPHGRCGWARIRRASRRARWAAWWPTLRDGVRRGVQHVPHPGVHGAGAASLRHGPGHRRPDAAETLRAREPELFEGLLRLGPRAGQPGARADRRAAVRHEERHQGYG
ncbi:hypothetical protein QJS66_18520 [Kocuria rhizophila]|nr:hypothetical protein QJS66_18520 [Kocuria rhizophila]